MLGSREEAICTSTWAMLATCAIAGLHRRHKFGTPRWFDLSHPLGLNPTVLMLRRSTITTTNPKLIKDKGKVIVLLLTNSTYFWQVAGLGEEDMQATKDKTLVHNDTMDTS